MSIKHNKYLKSISLIVMVDGVIYESAISAARYIVSKEPEKNVKTIAKEIRKCIAGQRPEWDMYGKYRIELVRI